jgi:prophage antirepressor-like protein
MRVRVFEYEGRVLRLLIREDGAIGAILNELAAFFGYKDAKDALAHVTKPGWKCTLAQFEEGGKHPPSSDATRGQLAASGKRRNRYNEGRQTVVLEHGINAMLLGSRLPAAQVCREWLCEEVMPAIARTGTYSVKTPQQSLQDTLTLLADRVGSTRIAARIGDGVALFCGLDLMRAIDLGNPRASLHRYLKSWGLPPDGNAYLTPAQVYDILTRSRKPKAQGFRHYTCAEVLPAHKPKQSTLDEVWSRRG